MKRPIYVLTIAAVCIYCTQMVSQATQPVTAYKAVGRTKEWTIGIYDKDHNLLSGKVVFRLNTNFVSDKGKKLVFDWGKLPNYIYVYKSNVGDGDTGINMSQDMSDLAEAPNIFVKSKPITPDDAPPGSKIKITASAVTIEKPKDTTRTITIYTIDESTNIITPLTPLTLQASKEDNVKPSIENLYGKPITIQKHIPGKTYKLTIPQGKDFYIIGMPDGAVSIPKSGIGPNTELAIGYNITGKPKSDRAKILKDTAQIFISLVKNCEGSHVMDRCSEDWTVKIYDAQENYTGFSKDFGTTTTQVRVPVRKPFWVYVSKRHHKAEGTEKTLITRSLPITKDDVMEIDKDRKAKIVPKGSSTELNTMNKPVARPQAQSLNPIVDVL